jgi:hypothetical protein
VTFVKLIRIGQAARLLGVDASALRRRLKGNYVEIFGVRIRAYPMDLHPDSERRFDEDEIRRVLARLDRAVSSGLHMKRPGPGTPRPGAFALSVVSGPMPVVGLGAVFPPGYQSYSHEREAHPSAHADGECHNTRTPRLILIVRVSSSRA